MARKKQSKTKVQFLKRSKRFMFRFSDVELRELRLRAKRAGLSQVEYGRRKIFDIPIAEVSPQIPAQPVAEIAKS